MQTVKYRYAYDENENIVCINELTPEARDLHVYKCISCGEILIPKLGEKKNHHFAHKSNVLCNSETYLHKLAKERILRKFLNGNAFNIELVAKSLCSERASCPFYNQKKCNEELLSDVYQVAEEEKCCKFKIIVEDLHKYYNQCEAEKSVFCAEDEKGKKRAFVFEKEDGCNHFVADILLWNDAKTKREPVAIEICVTHPCEESKKKSGLKIIEINVRNENDIERIVSGNIAGDNVNFINFNASAPDEPVNEVNVFSRLAFFKSGAVVNSTIEDYQYCSERKTRKNDYSVLELNMGYGNTTGYDTDDVYFMGLAYILNLGYNFKNCILCKYHKNYMESYTMEPFCACYKRSGIRNPRQKDAMECPYYSLNEEKIKDYREKAKTAPIEIAWKKE